MLSICLIPNDKPYHQSMKFFFLKKKAYLKNIGPTSSTAAFIYIHLEVVAKQWKLKTDSQLKYNIMNVHWT